MVTRERELIMNSIKDIKSINTMTNNEKGILFSLASIQSYQAPHKLGLPRAGITSVAQLSPFLNNNINPPTFISILGSEAYVMSTSDDVIVVCRGTEGQSLIDVLTGMRFATMSYRGGVVHRGFYLQYSKIITSITRTVANHNPDGTKSVWVTGHSLGGAIALLISLDIKPSGCYTFGQPRVGSGAWTSDIPFPYVRYHNNNDAVPHIPFVMLNYWHAGTLVYLDFNGNIVPYSSGQRVQDLSRSIVTAFKKRQWFDLIYDHKITLYHTQLLRAGQEDEHNR